MKTETGKHYLAYDSLNNLMVVKYIRNANKKDMKDYNIPFAAKDDYFIGEDVKYQYQYFLPRISIISSIRID